MREKIEEILKRMTQGEDTPEITIDKLCDLHNVIDSDFKKTLVCKDGGTWHLSDKEVKIWESGGSINKGDVLYKTVIAKLY